MSDQSSNQNHQHSICVGDIFTQKREECASTGLNYALCRITGGIILLNIHTEPEEPVRPGSKSIKTFVFRCITEGEASIQFCYFHASKPDVIIYEDVLPIDIQKIDAIEEKNSSIKYGGWTNNRELTDDDTALFTKVMGHLLGVKYTPLRVATQIVAGTNYRFLCEAQTVTHLSCEYHVLVYIFKPLPGTKEDPYCTNIVRLIGQ
ncbi:MAG TPA: hypothetical protein PLF38_04905 [Xylanibacter oryzae]|nr:hypothetical protein [Xylanibacter oryzae]